MGTLKHIWSGNFLDGKLNVFCDEDMPTVIHFRVTSYNIEISGLAKEPDYPDMTPRDRMSYILNNIKEKYIEAALVAKNYCIEHHECSIH